MAKLEDNVVFIGVNATMPKGEKEYVAMWSKEDIKYDLPATLKIVSVTALPENTFDGAKALVESVSWDDWTYKFRIQESPAELKQIFADAHNATDLSLKDEQIVQPTALRRLYEHVRSEWTTNRRELTL